MANIIKGKNLDPNQQSQDVAKIDQVGFGAKAAMAALQESKSAKTNQPAQNKGSRSQNDATTKEDRRQKRQAKQQQKTEVEKREETTRKIIGTNRGSITGAQVKSNLELTQKVNSSQVQDAWEDPNEVTSKDDETTALEKRLAQALEIESQIESPLEQENPIIPLSEANGLNDASQPIRNYSNFGTLLNSPDLLIMMNGISETFDTLLENNGIQMPDATTLDGATLQQIFKSLNLKKRKTLTEEEKEAELILAGAVAILAIPKIKEKLEELGLNPQQAESLKGILEKLIEEVKQNDHPYHHLYSLIKEETEYSIVPEDTDSAVN